MERLDDRCFDERWREALGQLTHAYKEKCEGKKVEKARRKVAKGTRGSGTLRRTAVA